MTQTAPRENLPRPVSEAPHAVFLITEDACVVHAPGLKGKPIAMGDAGQLARETPIFNIGFAGGRPIFSTGSLSCVIKRGSRPIWFPPTTAITASAADRW